MYAERSSFSSDSTIIATAAKEVKIKVFPKDVFNSDSTILTVFRSRNNSLSCQCIGIYPTANIIRMS